MKITTTIIKMIVTGVLIFGVAPQANAVFLSGSTGADGALNVTSNTTLSLPPSGIFNFTTLNVAAGATLTFAKNGANTPVYILATGDVVIDGTIFVSGQPGGNGQAGQASLPGAGGLGGFNGGQGGYGGNQIVNGSYGLGPYGGLARGSSYLYGEGDGGGYTNSSSLSMLLPRGGSGGGGGASGGVTQGAPTGSSGGSGGGGGGTIIIASSGTVTISGQVLAEGGKGGDWIGTSYPAGGGSGGFIRIVATKIAGAGFLSTKGGSGGKPAPGFYPGGNGANGITSLEALTFLFTGTTANGYSFFAPAAAIPPDLPTLKITSIGNQVVPANAGGTAQTIDITLPPEIVNPVPVTVSAANIQPGTAVNITVKSASGGGYQSVQKQLSGTQASSSAEGSLNLPSGVSIVEAYTPNSFTVTASLAPYLPMIGGEPVDQIKVGSVLGGEDKLALVTMSGREVPARWIAGTLVPLYEE